MFDWVLDKPLAYQKLNVIYNLKCYTYHKGARKDKQLHKTEKQLLQEWRGVLQKHAKIGLAK